MTAKRLLWAIAIATLVASGIYVVVYLYRWEWNRALMAGILLVAAEVGIATAVIMERLREISNRLDRLPTPREEEEVLDAVRKAAPPSKQHFAWLKGDGGEMNVFVPLLMGAGVLASGLAWVVERFAHATARPALERSLVARLAPLSLPEGGLVGPPLAAPTRRARRIQTLARHALITMVLVIVTAGILDKLADATQTRADTPLPGKHTRLELEVFTRNAGYPATTAVRGLIGICEGTVSGALAPDTLAQIAPGTFAMNIEPALGKYAERRLRGCLEDAALDNVQARVTTLAPVGSD